MKIECIKDHLEEALSKAEKIAGKNVNLPILTGLYINANKNTLLVKATNLDIGISVEVPVKVVEPGTVVVPAHTLSSFVSSLTNDRSVVLGVKNNILEVKTPSTKTIIKTLPSEEFPIIPEIEDTKTFSMPVADLISGIRSVIYATASGSIKPELASISITHDGEFLVFAATDSFRLAEKKIKVKKIPPFKQVLIPHKNASEIARIFDKNDSDISISIEENQIALRSKNVYVASRVIDGTFPDYKQIIPKTITSKAIMLKQDLVNSLKTSLIFSDSFNQLTFRLSPKGKTFEIDSKNSSVGESTQSIKAVLEGEDLSININHRYFTDCFQSIGTDSVSVSFSGQAKPAVVQGVGDTNFLYLVMPMNQS